MDIKNMGIDEMVKYINNELQRDKNIGVVRLRKNISEIIGINQDSLRKKLSKKYKWNEELRMYIKKEDIKSNTKIDTEISSDDSVAKCNIKNATGNNVKCNLNTNSVVEEKWSYVNILEHVNIFV